MALLPQFTPQYDGSGRAQFVAQYADPIAITLVTQFDTGNVDASTSSISNATSDSPTVNVKFRDLSDGWRHALFAVENAAGKTPVFSLDRTQRRNTGAVGSVDYRPVYTTDFETWVSADSVTFNTETIVFDFADPLPAGRVYVASNPVMQEAEAGVFADWLLTSRASVASPSASSDSEGVFNASPVEDDERGLPVGGRSMYGIALRFGGSTNDGGPKRKLVVFAGVHAAGESDSNLSFRYFVEYLIDSADSEAVALRANWDVDLYFNITPNGYFGGHPRTNFRSVSDPNRIWDSPNTEIAATQSAVLAEIAGGRFDACFSWHGWASSTTNFRGYLTPADNDEETRSPVVSEMLSAGATIFGVSPTFATSGTTNTDIWWAQNEGAKLSVNPEVPNFGDVSLANYQSIGENWAKTLQAVDSEGLFLAGTTIDAVGVQIAMTAHPAQVLTGTSLQAALAAIDLTPHAAAVSLGTSVDAAPQQIDLTPHPATVDLGTAIGANVASITLTAHPADVSIGKTISAAVQSISVTTHAAQVSTGAAIGAGVQQIVLAPHAAAVQLGTSIEAALAQMVLTANPATVNTGSGISAQAQQIVLEAFQAGVELGITIEGSLHQISVEALAATVGLGDQVEAFAQAIELTPHGASITLGTDLQANTAQIQLATFRAAVSAGVQPLTVPGLEFTLPADRMHFALPISRIHFTFTDEDR